MRLSASERDSVRAADWLEAEAVYSENGTASLEKLRSQIEMEGELVEGEDQREHEVESLEDVPSGPSERLVSNASIEIRRRIDICGDGYPFALDNGTLRWTRPGTWADPYIICLLASDRDLYRPGDKTALIFEHLTTVAVGTFWGGSAIRFGAPRDTMPKNLGDAISKLGEMTFSKPIDGWSIYPSDRDLGLDVVGWKGFPDQHNNQLQVYLQCATGEEWLEEKKGEPSLDTWRGLLLWGLPPVVAMAIPYVVNDAEKWQRNIAGRLLLDRLRIVSALSQKTLPDDGIDWADWAKQRVLRARSLNEGDSTADLQK